MSVISQFFPSGESSGGGGAGSSGYMDAKVLVVGGGGGGYCNFVCKASPPSCPLQCCSCLCVNYGSAGGVIYIDGVLKPGETCPIQVGTGSTSTNLIICSWCGPCACCFRYRFQDGGPGQASYFGGTSGLCAAGGCSTYVLCPTCTCPNAGSFYSCTGERNVQASGRKNFDKFESGFQTGVHTKLSIGNCIVGSGGAAYTQSTSISANSVVTDSNFTPIPTTAITGMPGCPSVFSRHHGFYHELLGPENGQVVGGAKFGVQTCSQGLSGLCSYCCEVLCPTYTDAIKNFGGLGNGTGSGGEINASVGGCPGSVIIQYPNTYDAVPAANRPGSTDCSPNTPGFYTYYYLTPGSITLP